MAEQSQSRPMVPPVPAKPCVQTRPPNKGTEIPRSKGSWLQACCLEFWTQFPLQTISSWRLGSFSTWNTEWPSVWKGTSSEGKGMFMATRLTVSTGTLGPQTQAHGQEGSMCLYLRFVRAGLWEKKGALETETKLREVTESQGAVAGRGEVSESL